MKARRVLIVNADDLGLSEGVNAGIVEAHERGIVTSASLMVHRPAAAAAAAAVGNRASLAVGLHLDIGAPTGGDAAVERECREQLDSFRSLLGREPTHIDSHHHTHMSEPVASAAAGLAEELGVPLRGRRIRYEGGFYGQTDRGEPWPEGIAVEHLIALIEALPEGWTELGCHPGLRVDAESSYGREREHEVSALCDARVRAAVEDLGIELRSFAELSGSLPSLPPQRTLDSGWPMEASERDSTREWLLPEDSRPPLLSELVERIDEALATARASEAAVMTVGAAAIEAAEQARRAAELAEKASAAMASRQAAAPPPPSQPAPPPPPRPRTRTRACVTSAPEPTGSRRACASSSTRR